MAISLYQPLKPPPKVLRDNPQGRLQRSGEGGNHRQLDLVKDARLTRSSERSEATVAQNAVWDLGNS